MILVALLIGAILVVASIRGTQGVLFSALATDVPGYVVWAAAIVALGAIGFVPELKPISRGLLILVVIVIVLRNYQQIIAGFQGSIKSAETAPSSGEAASGAPVTSGLSSSPAALPGSSPGTGIISAPSLSVAAPQIPATAPSLGSPTSWTGDLFGSAGVEFHGNNAPSGFGAEFLGGSFP